MPGDPPQPAPIPGRQVLSAMLVVLMLAVVPAVIVPPLMCRHQQAPIEDLGVLPAFALTDETGTPATEAALRGHITIVNFIFTRCTTICPAFSMKMEHVQEQTADLGDQVKLLSISVDPQYDTPDRLRDYAARFHAEPRRWHFLTGPIDAIRAVVEQGLLTAMVNNGVTPSGTPDIAHGQHFILLDENLHLRGAYDSNDVTRIDQMVRNARRLVRLMKP